MAAVALDGGLTGTLRSLDARELRRVLILVRGLLLASGDAPPPEAIELGRVTYRLEGVRCGKPGCGACPHGPYWYAFYREGEGCGPAISGATSPARQEK